MTRGKHGPTHISPNKLTERQQIEMQLWSERLNGATADTLKHINKITDGAPNILLRADRHNALSKARLHASGKQIHAPAVRTPTATKPGERTAIDWWDAPCTGILGSTGMFCPIDIFSGYFKAYPMQSKSDSHLAIDLYYRDAAHDGVIIPPGSVIFSDNEKIFTGRKFESEVAQKQAVHEYSAEYEPWGNGAAEHVNTVLPEMMRTVMNHRGDTEHIFWEFAAVDCAALLVRVTTRRGKSLREAWCDRRGNVSNKPESIC